MWILGEWIIQDLPDPVENTRVYRESVQDPGMNAGVYRILWRILGSWGKY
jgi:hypothetical protein